MIHASALALPKPVCFFNLLHVYLDINGECPTQEAAEQPLGIKLTKNLMDNYINDKIWGINQRSKKIFQGVFRIVYGWVFDGISLRGFTNQLREFVSERFVPNNFLTWDKNNLPLDKITELIR